MEQRPGVGRSIGSLLLLVAAVAVNVASFRASFLLGFVALNVTKHLAIAHLCRVIGVNRRLAPSPEAGAPAARPLVSGTAMD